MEHGEKVEMEPVGLEQGDSEQGDSEQDESLMVKVEKEPKENQATEQVEKERDLRV
jgi:hypothetical protein